MVDHATGCTGQLVALKGWDRVPLSGVPAIERGQQSPAAARENLAKSGKRFHHKGKQQKRGPDQFWNHCPWRHSKPNWIWL